MDRPTAPIPRPRPAGNRRRAALALAFAAALAGCAGNGAPRGQPELAIEAGIALQTHRDGDDLLTAGLGEAGLRSPAPPAFADAAAPTAAELRRRAIWANWRGIADLAPGGGYGSVYGSLRPVPGREYHALLRLPGRGQPHRVMLQVPDGFDAGQRCVVVTASSGSRGIYGAIALAGAWGLPRGCAVAYTDKGAGTGYVDTADGRGTGLDGRPAAPGEPVEFAVPASPAVAGAVAPIAVKHAHSGDNPEADWGRHVAQAADFALQALSLARPQDGPWTHANTRVIAVGVSNGGGAVLRAAELPGGRFDAVVAISPNVLPGTGGRALYDYVTEAALWLPCAQAAPAFDGEAFARPGGAPPPAAGRRCLALATQGSLAVAELPAMAESARARLRASGWTDEALSAATPSTAFDLWRAIGATYASAYARTGPSRMPCGYSFAAMGADGVPRAPTAAERAAWWSDASGIPPGAGVGLREMPNALPDPSWPGLRCLREQWEDAAGAVRAGVEATRAGLPRAGLPVLVVHGADDGLVPEAFSGGAYAAWADAAGRPVSYWRVRNAQHFDAFLGLPALATRYLPMLAYGYHALDAAWATVAGGAPLPGDAEIANTPRALVDGAPEPLAAKHLGAMP